MLAPAVAVPERHRPSWWYAHHTVVHWMHRQVYEWISIGYRLFGSFRAVSAALLKRFLSSGPKTFEEIDEYLAVARLHPMGRHWVDNLSLSTLLIHQFERAEREGDYYLKQLTMERMLKYFFLAGHVQYARYLTQYLLEMRHLSADAKRDLVSGAFVCRHHEGYWNAVSGDQFGEQTAIRMGKGALKVPPPPESPAETRRYHEE